MLEKLATIVILFQETDARIVLWIIYMSAMELRAHANLNAGMESNK